MTRQETVGAHVVASAPPEHLRHPYALEAGAVLSALASSPQGLAAPEAAARLARFGPNAMPRAAPPGVAVIFARQFKSPLMYVLLAAALVSAALGEWSDAAFIFGAVLINAFIGTYQ